MKCDSIYEVGWCKGWLENSLRPSVEVKVVRSPTTTSTEGLRLFSSQPFHYPTYKLLPHYIPIRQRSWNRQSVPKRWHLNYRRRGKTQKKAYDISNIVLLVLYSVEESVESSNFESRISV
jgi:hypothetical protein